MSNPPYPIQENDLPVARQVDDDHGEASNLLNPNNNPWHAVPIQVFDYENALENELGQHDEQVAYPIPSSSGHHQASIADDSRSTVKLAEHIGVIRSEEEKDAIRKASRQIFAHNYFEEKSIQAANEIAKQRDREGLQMPVPPPQQRLFLSQNLEGQTVEYRQNRDHHGGGHPYQIKEYEIGENYETNTYEVKEYKSVYD
jgi:hypothetical protein